MDSEGLSPHDTDAAFHTIGTAVRLLQLACTESSLDAEPCFYALHKTLETQSLS